MSYTAIHEILYRDELGQVASVPAGSTLTKDQEKALSKDLAGLVKSKAIKSVKTAESPASKSDGFGK